MNIYHLKKIRKKYQYKFIDGVLHVFNHKMKEHDEYNSISKFIVNYVYDAEGIISGCNYEIRTFERIRSREYYKSLTELKIKDI